MVDSVFVSVLQVVRKRRQHDVAQHLLRVIGCFVPNGTCNVRRLNQAVFLTLGGQLYRDLAQKRS